MEKQIDRAGSEALRQRVCAESFFSRFKTELKEDEACLNLEDAKTEIFEFIEIYYNRKRRHSALNYKNPLEYEKTYYMSLG